LLKYLVPLWRRLALLFVVTALFAALSGVSLGLIPPFLHILFGEGMAPGITEQVSSERGIPLPGSWERAKTAVLDSARSFIYGGTPVERLARFCLVFLGLMILKNIFGYLSMYMTISLEQSVLYRVRNDRTAKRRCFRSPFSTARRRGISFRGSRTT
jgi:ABC-type multidrug transport system fused ATPase/permease subunit